jgi:hypothetical protein
VKYFSIPAELHTAFAAASGCGSSRERENMLIILNEKDCIKIKARTWLDKKDWREIHDILRVQGFNWLANGKDSCWIKMLNQS